MTNLKVRAARGSIYMTVITLGLRPGAVALAIILARLLSPHDFGLLALAMLVFNYANMITDLGMRPTVVQTKEDINKVAYYAFVMVMAASITFTVACILLAEPLTRLLGGSEELIPILRWMAVYVTIDGLWIIPESLLRRDLRFKELGLSQLPGELASTIIAIPLAMAGFGVWSLVIGNCAGQLLRAALLWFYYRPWIWIRPQKWDKEIVRKMLNFGLPSLGSGLLRYIQGLDTLIVGRRLGPSSVGLYNKAMGLTARITEMVSNTIFGNILFPSYAKIQDDKPRLARAYLKSTKMVLLMIVPVSLGLALTASLFVPVLLGPKWIPMIPLWQIFSLFGLTRPISANSSPIFLATGQPRRNMTASLLSMGLMFPLVLLLITPYGAIGAAVAVSITSLIVMFFNVFQVNQILPGTAVKTLTQSLSFLLAGGLMSLVVWLTYDYIITLAGGENVLALILVILEAALVYVAVILVLERPLVMELYELFVKAMGLDKRWPRLLPAHLRSGK